jgi:hypothetical protein
MAGVIFLIIHLCSLESFGESYLGGLFDVAQASDWKDEFVRLPETRQKLRPKQFAAQDADRAGE